jgi:hypothetical protein
MLQVVLLYTFVQQHHVQQLLLASITLDLHEDEDDAIESSLPLNFFKTIFLKQRVPHPLPPINRSVASLDPSWCYRYTRFTNHQLQLLYELLNPPPQFTIQNGKCHCSSNEAFIVHQVGNRGYQPWTPRCFWRTDQRILDIYNHAIWWLDDKAQGSFCQPCLEQWKDNFLRFAGAIGCK